MTAQALTCTSCHQEFACGEDPGLPTKCPHCGGWQLTPDPHKPPPEPTKAAFPEPLFSKSRKKSA